MHPTHHIISHLLVHPRLYSSCSKNKFHTENRSMQMILHLYNYKLNKSFRKQPQSSISSTDNSKRNAYNLLMASSISEIWSFSWFHCSGFREIPRRNLKMSNQVYSPWCSFSDKYVLWAVFHWNLLNHLWHAGLTEVITFFPWLHLPILVHPVLSDVNQDFTFEVPDADISHLSNL